MWALLSRSARTPAIRPSHTLFFWVLGAFVMTLLPHATQLPLWISAGIGLGLGVRAFLELRRLPLPSSTFCGVLALCLLAATYLQFHSIFGRDAGTAFMAGLLAIKFYEIRGPRDVALIIFSCFFVVMSALLYSQAMELFFYCLAMMWLLTALLLRTQRGDLPEDRILPMLRAAGSIFLQALPLAVFLFFFLPRYNGKFPLGLDDASPGITSRIEPGSIARLSENEDTAMRVTFKGNVPAIQSMYWRALVFWHYAGGAWTPGAPADVPLEKKPIAVSPNDLITQQITIWPNYQRWLFALDYPVSEAENWSDPTSSSVMFFGHVLQLPYRAGKVDHKEQYTVVSSLGVPSETLSDSERKDALELPREEIGPRVTTLADQLRHDNPDDEAFVRSVLHYFRRENFRYDADPGVESKDALTDFLFQTKSGFCEHYASAFAVLMRLGGVPTRLIGGYYGAQYNYYGNFYIVKQSNAHAWDEVWIQAKQHWMRVDPTAALALGNAPQLASANAPSGADAEDLSLQVAHHRFVFLSNVNLPEWMRRGLFDLQLRRQQIEAGWDDWVFSYDSEAQNRLAHALGLGRNARLLMALASLAAAGLCVVVFRRLLKRQPKVTPVDALYDKFSRSMAQRGVPRAAWEGPLAYTERVAQAFPEKKEAIKDFGEIVAQTRYGPQPEPEASRRLQSLLLLLRTSQAASSSRDRN